MPHAHILLILNDIDKPTTQYLIDQIVKAEIPDIKIYPKLYNAVLTHMIHGPCGKSNPNAICMKNNVCIKSFPKEKQHATQIKENSFAIYKRNSSHTATVRGHVINDGYVVPYNPHLLLKYNCHINVEICSSIKAVKYLFKYIYKGHDCADIEFHSSNADEIQAYIDTR